MYVVKRRICVRLCSPQLVAIILVSSALALWCATPLDVSMNVDFRPSTMKPLLQTGPPRAVMGIAACYAQCGIHW